MLSRLHHLQVYPPEGASFDVTFEEFGEQLSTWTGMYFEMDGSFVWVLREQNEVIGQIDGMVYDRSGHIEYLELKGAARDSDWHQIFQSLVSDRDLYTWEDLRCFDVTQSAFVSAKKMVSYP